MESFRNLLSVEECIIIKDGNKVLIPKKLWKDMMMKLHYTHLVLYDANSEGFILLPRDQT